MKFGVFVVKFFFMAPPRLKIAILASFLFLYEDSEKNGDLPTHKIPAHKVLADNAS